VAGAASHYYKRSVTPTTISHTDQATYAIGVKTPASFQPFRSNASTNSREHIIRSAPTTMPATPDHQGVFVA
jgi:membrane carboxypeptidase/penicillin-binding protein